MLFDTVVGRTKFNPEPLEVDGMKVIIGTVDDLGNDAFLMISFSKVILLGIGTFPAIVISENDIAYLLDRENNISSVQGLVSFAIAHELGHIKQWQTFPETCGTGELSTAMEPEVVADCYGIRVNGIRQEIYHKYIGMFRNALGDRVNNSRTSWLNRTVVNLYNRGLLKKRIKMVDRRAKYGDYGTSHRSDDPSYEVSVKVVGKIIDRNEGRWTDE